MFCTTFCYLSLVAGYESYPSSDVGNTCVVRVSLATQNRTVARTSSYAPELRENERRKSARGTNPKANYIDGYATKTNERRFCVRSYMIGYDRMQEKKAAWDSKRLASPI